MVGYASTSSSSARSSTDASSADEMREIWTVPSVQGNPYPAASGAELGNSSSGSTDSRTPAASGAEKVLAGFGKSSDGPLAGLPSVPTVIEINEKDFAQVQRIPDEEDEDGNQLYALVEPALPGVKVKERTATQLKRLPKDIIEELIRPFLLQAIDNPDGVAALIERFLLARWELLAFQALKTSSKQNRKGIGGSLSAAGGADLKGPAPKWRCSSCFAPWADLASDFVACRNCQSDKPLTTLEEGLSYSAAGTEWKLIVTRQGRSGSVTLAWQWH